MASVTELEIHHGHDRIISTDMDAAAAGDFCHDLIARCGGAAAAGRMG